MQSTHDTEKLYELLITWYNSILFSKQLSSVHIVECWTNIWFAKDANQKKMDDFFLKYTELVGYMKDFKPTDTNLMIAMIILYDQIPRNIHRNTADAYTYDHISLGYAHILMNTFASLPFQYKLTVTICLLHSENRSDHDIVKENLKIIKKDKCCDPMLYERFSEIAKNHAERILYFGRIPERNKFLGRESTEQEIAYLGGIY